VDLPLPAFAHVAVGRLIARQDEGGVHKANARAARFPGKGEGDDGIERRTLADIAFMAALPGIDEALVRGDL
jgi:hypothetical protein